MAVVKVGVIGAGKIATFQHLPEYKANPGVELAAICENDPAQAKLVAEQFGIPGVFSDLDEFLAKSGVDAVSVCTPNHLHAPVTIKALKAGKHVLVEKPMATAVPDADEMIATALKAGKVLMVGQSQRLMPPHRAAKHLLDSGALGRVNTFRSVFGHPGPEFWSPRGKWFFKKGQAFAGSMFDLGIHKADLLRWLVGSEIVEVGAFTSTFEKEADVDDNAIVLCRMANGAFGTIATSWTTKPVEDNSTILYCEKGTLYIGTDPTRPVYAEIASPLEETVAPRVGGIRTNEGGPSNSGVIDGFVSSIESGKSLIPGEEGRAALAAIAAALKSAETGQFVKVS